MHFRITLYTDQPTIAHVQNISEQDFHGKLPLKAGETVELTRFKAKNLFGDWENDTYGEKRRQQELNIHRYTVEICTKTALESIAAPSPEEIPKTKPKEPEFADLDALNTPMASAEETVEETVEEVPDEVETGVCKGKTKAGNPCKMKATEHGFCGIHQPTN